MSNGNNKEQICVGGRTGEIQLYEIEQQQQPQPQTRINLIQTFPKEHPSYPVFSLIQPNQSTLISACTYSSSSSDNIIVVWAKSQLPSSSSLYEPIQRMKKEEAGKGIHKLLLLNTNKDEEVIEFASCSNSDRSITIWRRSGDELFKIKQKISDAGGIVTSLHISLTNELISVSFFPELIQIWSSSSPSSNYEKRQTIELPFSICSLCQITENNSDSKVELASGSTKGEIQIWSKEINSNNSSDYSHIKTLKFYNHFIPDLMFIGGEFNLLISCCKDKSTIVLYRKKKDKEELQHDGVSRLIHLSNGIFASGAENGLLKIWSPKILS